jgi:hypothetical protein
LIVFSRERILIDTNLANGFLWRQAAAGKTVNENLTAVWTGRRTSERLQRCREFVRIVRQRIQIFSGNQRLVCIAGCVGADWCFRINSDLLFFNRHF